MPLKMFQEKSSSPKILAVAAGKGGVGKSTVAVNLALSLQKKRYAVGILDTDLYGPSVRKMLPEDQMPQQNGNEILPAICKGIRVISMAYFRDEKQAAVVRAPIANGIITQFIKQVAWGELDYLIVDFPPGTGDIQLTLAQQANLTGALMVTTPQEVAVLDVRKAMNLFTQVNVPIVGIVENMSYFEASGEKIPLFGEGGGKRLANETGVPFLGQVPVDPIISRCADKGESLLDQKNSRAAEAFEVLAERLIKQLDGVDKRLGIHELTQIDAHSFSIIWSDGVQQKLRLSDLQKRCPCANCVDEHTGKRKVDPGAIDENVGATRIDGVGRYAIQIDFTSGCSTGIYEYELLRGL